MKQGGSKTHAENMLMSMFKLQQKSCLTDVTIVCKDGLLYGEYQTINYFPKADPENSSKRVGKTQSRTYNYNASLDNVALSNPISSKV